MKFTPRADSPIVAEMLRQDFIPDYSEASREIHLDQEATETDKAIALGTAALGVGCMAGVLGLAGLSAPIIIPVFALAGGALHAWNSMATVRNRELELQFLRDHPDVLEAAAAKMDNSNEDAYKIGNAYEGAFRAYRMGEVPKLAEVKERSVVEPTSTPLPTASTWEATASSAPPAATPSAVQPPMQSPAISQSDRAALIARLKEDCPLMLKLVKSHPIRAVGAQRSGKTTLVKKLCLLRMLLLSGHGVVAATPHYEPENPYPKVFRVAGVDMSGNRDYPAIEAQWDDMASRVESCQTSNQTYVWDEFGLFDKVMPAAEGKDAPPCKIKTVLTSCLRETMKFGIYPIFIVHGETAAFLPGSKGLVTVFIGSTVRVETIGEAVEGDDGLETIQPTGKFNVTWLDGTKAEGQIPAWMTEEYLLSLLGNVKPPSAPLPTAPGPSPRRGRLVVPTREKMPESWETIGKAMAVTAGMVTTETPGTITSDGVKLPINNRSQTDIHIDALVQRVRSLPLPSETISGFMIETSKMKGYQVIGYLEAILNEYKPRHPAPATGGPTAISSADGQAIPYGVTIDAPELEDDEAPIRDELIRYLTGAREPKRVTQIRSGAREPVRKMDSKYIRAILEEMVEDGDLKEVNGRFTTL
jgi:hypothetical protein